VLKLLLKIIHDAIGLNSLSFLVVFSMIVRGIIIYFFGITLARFNKKLLGIRTPFNFILFIILGSIFANAIVDAAMFLPILGTILLLMLLNGFMTMMAFYFPAVELFVKGSPSILVREGEIQWYAMQKNFITKNELFNELHAQLHTNSLVDIKSAILASDGSINFITKKELIK
jgi:uncharacterized membrane protein YcaP (DUF421 family)